MLRLFSRPVGRPRNVRRPPARPVLRVETLETRANPSAPVLTVVHPTWSDPNDIVVTGTVSGDNTATTQVTVYSGGALASAYASSAGGFTVSLHTNAPGPDYIQAHNDQGQDSAVVMDTSNPAGVGTTAPTIGNVTVTWSNGGWVISGTVTGGSPGSTIINVGGTGGNNGGTVLQNGDGTFTIGITSGPGGVVSITATNGDTGATSDPVDTVLD
jgi:hypothetical protein